MEKNDVQTETVVSQSRYLVTYFPKGSPKAYMAKVARRAVAFG